MEVPSYYAVIPAKIRYDKELKANEKLLYGEISALSNKNGYCNASNMYFADLYFVNKKTISTWVNHLKEKGYIEIELIYEDQKIVERRIYIEIKNKQVENEVPIHEKMDTSPSKNGYPIHQNMEENNTSNNNKEKEEEDFSKIVKFYEENITLITPFVAEEIQHFLEDGLEADLIISALKETVSRNKRNWKYARSILKNCDADNIKTEKAFLKRQEEFKQNKNAPKLNDKKETKEKVEYEEMTFESEEDYERRVLGKET